MVFNCSNTLPKISDNYLYDILHERGIEDVDEYLHATKDDCTDGFLLDNMDKAIAAVKDAVDNKKKIVISVDADTDGYTSASMMYGYLKEIDNTLDISYLVHEGKQHGVDDFMDDFTRLNPDLIIIPDASSSELEVHKQLFEAGITVVVLDHHLSDIKEDPYAIRVNNQLSKNFSNKTLCGAGVVYKFFQCYDETYGYNFANHYIDLAAVGLVSDMMDLRNIETRYLVRYGLTHIRNAGLRHLVEASSYSLNGREDLTPTDVAFYIAPAINAIIRVGTQESKKILFEALLDGDRVVPSTKRGAKPGDTEILGAQAARIATNAKNLQKRLIEKAMDVVEAKIFKYDLLENKIILIPVGEEDDVHPSLTGLVAMKITAKYHKPTLILRECDDGVFKGSGRAETGTEMGGFKEYLEQSKFFDFSAGHSMAFGAGIKEDKINDFLTFSNDQLKNVDFNEKCYNVDYVFDRNDYFDQLVYAIDAGKDIWGQGVQEPTIGVVKLPISKKDVTLMKNNCLKFTYNNVSYVIFKNEQAVEDFTQYNNMLVTVYGKCNVNEWCGRKTCQVFINSYEITNNNRQF